MSPDWQDTTFIKIIISPVQQLFKNFLCLTIKIIRPLPAAIRLIRTAWGKDGSYKKMLVHFQTASQHFHDFSTKIFKTIFSWKLKPFRNITMKWWLTLIPVMGFFSRYGAFAANSGLEQKHYAICYTQKLNWKIKRKKKKIVNRDAVW